MNYETEIRGQRPNVIIRTEITQYDTGKLIIAQNWPTRLPQVLPPLSHYSDQDLLTELQSRMSRMVNTL